MAPVANGSKQSNSVLEMNSHSVGEFPAPWPEPCHVQAEVDVELDVVEMGQQKYKLK